MAATLYIDFETSGLDSDRHGIIQAAWIVEENGKVTAERCMDVCLSRGCDIDPVALDINGFTLERIKEGKSLEYMLAALQQNLSAGFMERVIPCGHNVSFDLDFLVKACNRTRDRVDTFVDFSRVMDTLPLARWLNLTGRIRTDNNKLKTLCDFYGIEIIAHDALSDVKAVRELAHIFFDYLTSLPKVGPKGTGNYGE